MSTLNIEVHGKKVVRLTVLPSGEVEIVVSPMTSREGKDIIIATIPENRREVVANFIANAP